MDNIADALYATCYATCLTDYHHLLAACSFKKQTTPSKYSKYDFVISVAEHKIKIQELHFNPKNYSRPENANYLLTARKQNRRAH